MKFPYNLLRPVLKVGFRKHHLQPQAISLLGCEYRSLLVMELVLTVPGVVFSNQMQPNGVSHIPSSRSRPFLSSISIKVIQWV
jgi:hypothetical protein